MSESQDLKRQTRTVLTPRTYSVRLCEPPLSADVKAQLPISASQSPLRRL